MAEAENTIWVNFVAALRREQNALRAYLAHWEKHTQAAAPIGSRMANEGATVRKEIETLQRTINRVISEQGLTDA
jgi:hypothetical protein